MSTSSRDLLALVPVCQVPRPSARASSSALRARAASRRPFTALVALALSLPLGASLSHAQQGPPPRPESTPTPTPAPPKLDPVRAARLVDSYVLLLENESPRVRSKALEMLGGFGTPARRVRPAIRTALADEAPEVRSAALKSLALLGRRDEDLSLIAESLRDGDLYVRGAAAAALGTRGPQAASSAPALAARLYAPGEVFGVKVSVLRALAAMGPAAQGTLPLVIRFVGDPEQGQIGREAGVEALGKIGRGQGAALHALRTVLRRGELRVAAARALIPWGPDAAAALPDLSVALENQDAMLRWRALQVVTAIGPAARSTRPALERILVRPGRDLRLEAARALGAIRDRRAIPALEAHLKEAREGHDVLLEVERALVKLRAIKPAPSKRN